MGIGKWNNYRIWRKYRRIILQRMKEIWNDQLLTDRYLSGTSAIQIVDYDLFYSLYWYDGGYDNYNAIRNLTNDAIAQEPLEIMAEVVRPRPSLV